MIYFARNCVCLVLIAMYCCPAVSYVPESELLPIFLESFDEPKGNGDFSAVLLERNLKFLGVQYSTVFVSKNGYIGFNAAADTQLYENSCSEHSSDTPIVAPFVTKFHDMHINHPIANSDEDGTLLIQTTTNISSLAQVTRDVQKAFPESSREEITWILYVTWYNVESNFQRNNLKNTFQAVLATNDEETFVLFYYNKINSYYQDSSNSGPMAGILEEHEYSRDTYYIPGSCSMTLLNLEEMSNIGEPGKFVFRVRHSIVLPTVTPQCQLLKIDKIEEKHVHFTPHTFPLVGKSHMLVNGLSPLCINYQIKRVKCLLRTPTGKFVAREDGEWLPGNLGVFCIKPELNITGLLVVDVTIVLTDIHLIYATGTILVVPEIPATLDVQLDDIKNDKFITVSANFGSKVASENFFDPVKLVSYPVTQVVPPKNSLEVNFLEWSGHKWRTLESFSCSEIRNCHGNLSAKDVNNLFFQSVHTTLKTVVVYNITDFGSGLRIVSQVVANLIQTTLTISKHDGLANLQRSNVHDQRCQQWFDNEPSPPKDALPCPFTLFQAKRDWRFKLSTLSTTQGTEMNPGNFTVYLQASPSPSGAGSQCVYQNDGDLVYKAPYGSRLMKICPNNQDALGEYYNHDVVPYLDCCLFSFRKQENCAKYFFGKRPPFQHTLYEFPVPFRATGAAQITTLGGSTYLLNALGWFWLASAEKNFMVQVLAEPFSKNPQQKHELGIVISNAVVSIERPGNGETIKLQVTANTEYGLLIWLDGEPLNFFYNDISDEIASLEEQQSLTHHQVSILVNGGTDATLSCNGVSIKFRLTAGNRSLEIIGSVSKALVDNTKGLIGKQMSVSMNAQLVEYWRDKPGKILLELPLQSGNNISTKFQADFKVSQLSRFEVFQNVSLPIATFCQHNENCMIDYQLTGDKKFATSSNASYYSFLELEAANMLSFAGESCRIPGNVENGQMVGQNVWVGAEIKVVCKNEHKLMAASADREISFNDLVFTCVPNESVYGQENFTAGSKNASWVNLKSGIVLSNISLKCTPISEQSDTEAWIVFKAVIISNVTFIILVTLLYWIFMKRNVFRRSQTSVTMSLRSLLES